MEVFLISFIFIFLISFIFIFLIELCVYVLLNVHACDHLLEVIRRKKIVLHGLHERQGFLLSSPPFLVWEMLLYSHLQLPDLGTTFFFFFLVVPHNMWDLSSPTRDQTYAPTLEVLTID